MRNANDVLIEDVAVGDGLRSGYWSGAGGVVTGQAGGCDDLQGSAPLHDGSPYVRSIGYSMNSSTQPVNHIPEAAPDHLVG